MSKIYDKLREFCEEIKPEFLEKRETNLKNISDYYPEGFRVNIIVKDKKNMIYTLFISNTDCKVLKGFSSSQLNLSADLETWNNIFLGKDRVIKAIMEDRVKLRGIRPKMSLLIFLSSLIYLYAYK
jgi:putative sterol carrier protein